jgi:hypothetical protein
MTKKLFVLVAFFALLGGGAFAQLAIGVTGALHMDQQMSASEIANAYQNGDNILYGAFVEILGKHLGLGVGANFTAPYDTIGDGINLMDYDADLYLSYHLFKATSFIDPFLEAGVGLMATTYQNSKDVQSGAPDPIAASPYYYGALGLGINLGRTIGVFGKFAYNIQIARQLTYTDAYGDTQNTPYYGYWYQNANGVWVQYEYVPRLRFTMGLKLIL